MKFFLFLFSFFLLATTPASDPCPRIIGSLWKQSAELTDAEIERKLTDEPIDVTIIRGEGQSNPLTVTFKNKMMAVFKPEARDAKDRWDPQVLSYYHNEIAAYEFDKVVGFDLVSPTVKRVYMGRTGSMQLIVPHEKWDHVRSGELLIFDYLTQNNDRHRKNAGVLPGKRILAFDNSLSFGLAGATPAPEMEDLKNVRVRRSIYENLKSLAGNFTNLDKNVKPWLEGNYEETAASSIAKKTSEYAKPLLSKPFEAHYADLKERIRSVAQMLQERIQKEGEAAVLID